MSRLADVPLFKSLPSFPVSAADITHPISGVPEQPEVEWTRVVALRRRASEDITRELETHAARTGTPMHDTDRRLLGRSVVRRLVREHAEERTALGEALWTMEREHAYAVAVENAIFGYGRMQPLFEIPGAENIELNGAESAIVQFSDGRREAHPPVADSDEELIEAVRFLGESVNPPRPFDDAHPTMTLGFSRNRLTRA